MRIIPAIDIINGKCVRLTKGDYGTQKIYNESPLEIAKEFEDNGFQYLHLVDLDGAKSQHIVNHKVLYEISTKTNLKIDFGGGVKSNEDLQIAFENGASQIIAGTIAADNPALVYEWLVIYGAEKIILGADCYDHKITTHGWLVYTELDVLDYINDFAKRGISYVICTDISKDGMLLGPPNELYVDILKKINIKLIASGGVSSIRDVERLKEIQCEGVIIGKAIFENKINLNELGKLC